MIRSWPAAVLIRKSFAEQTTVIGRKYPVPPCGREGNAQPCPRRLARLGAVEFDGEPDCCEGWDWPVFCGEFWPAMFPDEENLLLKPVFLLNAWSVTCEVPSAEFWLDRCDLRLA